MYLFLCVYYIQFYLNKFHKNKNKNRNLLSFLNILSLYKIDYITICETRVQNPHVSRGSYRSHSSHKSCVLYSHGIILYYTEGRMFIEFFLYYRFWACVEWMHWYYNDVFFSYLYINFCEQNEWCKSFWYRSF